MLENTKSPLLDGLNVAAIPTTGVSQEKLDPLIRIGRCHLDTFILENGETSVNITFLIALFSDENEEEDEDNT